MPLEVKSYNNPKVIDTASDNENSDEIPPTEPPPAYFSSNTLRRKKTTRVFCDSGCAHTLINESTPEDLPDGHDIVPSSTLAAETPRTHQHRPKDRPDPEPPDIS